MIYRGKYLILSPTEMMERIKRKSTLKVLNQLMWTYEARERRIACPDHGYIAQIEVEEFHKLMRLVGQWLQPMVEVDFGTRKSRRDVNDAGPGGGSSVNLSKAERRRRRRQERKNNLNGVCRSS